MSDNGQTAWRIKGEEVASCNCDWACPCQFNSLPTHGNCKIVYGMEIKEGQFGDTDMAGARFAQIIAFPGPIHEGDGTVQIVFDEGTSEEQRSAIGALSTGEHGGTFFEIFASVLAHVRDPIVAPVALETDRETRHAMVKIGDLAGTTIAPITNPITGDEHRIRIDLPEGFEYKLAEIANSVEVRASAEAPLEFAFEGTYGQLSEFDWSNA